MAQTASKTCDICVGAAGTHYCLECEQYFCDNCKGFHKRQTISKDHRFQFASDVIPEGISKCKDHNEDIYFVCNTCNVAVCSSCVTGSHKRHDLSKLRDSISRLKASNEAELYSKVEEAATNLEKIEKGIQAFDVKVERVVKAITEEGTKIKAMVDMCIGQMIASVKDQSRKEKDNLTQKMADTKVYLKAGRDLDKKLYDLYKAWNDGKLLQSLQKLTHDIANLTIEPITEDPDVHYTAKSVTDHDILQLFGTFKISGVHKGQTGHKESELQKPKSDYKKNIKQKEHKGYLFRCETCGKPCSCGGRMDRIHE